MTAPSRRKNFGQDLLGVVVLGAASLLLGMTLNASRAQPLPWHYVSPLQRLRGESLPPEMALADFQRLVFDHQGLVIDARPAVFYAEAHVPGAVNLPRASFAESFRALKNSLAKYQHASVAVYCSGTECTDSQLVAVELTKVGFTNVSVYRSGWAEWSVTGLPQEGKAATP